MLPNPPKIFAVATVIAIALTFLVRSQFEAEARSLLTGVALIGPLFGVAGVLWSDKLDERGLLGPKAKWAIPDLEQMLEGVAVLFAALITYWLLLNGPSVEDPDPGRLNSFANSLRNFRAAEGTPDTDLVPSTNTWFVIGVILSAPFWFSLGSMITREFIGRAKRRDTHPVMSALESGEGYDQPGGEIDD